MQSHGLAIALGLLSSRELLMDQIATAFVLTMAHPLKNLKKFKSLYFVASHPLGDSGRQSSQVSSLTLMMKDPQVFPFQKEYYLLYPRFGS